MNHRNEILLVVGQALKQLEKLPLVYQKSDGSTWKIDIPTGQLEYASEILVELARGLPHKRPPGRFGGRPAKTPKGLELFELQAKYKSGEIPNLMRFLGDNYPDAAVSTLEKVAAKIRKGINLRLLEH